MKTSAFKPGWTLLMLLVLILAAAPAATAADQPTGDDGGSVSPSQVSRDRINAIRDNEFFYQSFGRQDPFKILVAGDFEQAKAGGLLDVNSAHLVGVMWAQDDRFALVENGDGFGYILRVGDRIKNGRVVSIRKNSLTARVTLYGITNKVVLKLEKSEG